MNNKVSTVPEEQWNLPVSTTPDGQQISLREFIQAETTMPSFGQLSLDQQAELVAERIASQPQFEVAMVGPGLVNKARAVQEVRTQTHVGRTLIEIEQRMIARMIKRARERNI